MLINKETEGKKVIYNVIFSCIAFLTNAYISLFITPFITESLGAEAYGFVKLANDFASYGSLVTLALNSMSSRFIMLANEKGNQEEARAYYTSVTIANILLAVVLLIPSLILVLCVNRILDVPQGMLKEVQFTFIWTFTNFLVCLAGTTFGNCFFLKNKLYISSIITSVTSLLRAIFIVVVFGIVGPKISILAFGAIVVTAIFMPCNVVFHRKLTPELYFDKRLFDFNKIRVVVASGIWNSITRLSQILTTGLDLLITNLLLGALEMGYLSVAKTIPNYISSLINTLGNAFTPNMMQYYAKNDMEGLNKTIRSSMRLMSIFSTIPNAILITMGTLFYSLWVPDQPSKLINTLSVITVIGSCVQGPMQPLYQVFTLTNKIRQSSIAYIIQGFLSILVTILCVKHFGLGVYAIAGVSVLLSIFTALGYHLPMAAVYIGLPWHSFYWEIIKNILILFVQCFAGFAFIHIYAIKKSWFMLIVGVVILGIFGLVFTSIMILDKEEKQHIVNMFSKKIQLIRRG